MKKLKLGIIGTGGICNNKHLPSLVKVADKIEVAALCDLLEEKAFATAEKHGLKDVKIYDTVFDENGNATMKPTVELGLTIDERLADGYYYSKTIKLLKKLLENPELLELPANEKVEY